MTREERIKEIAKASPDFGKRVGYKMCVVDELHDIKELEKENAELKELNEALTNENDEMIKGLGCKTCQIHTKFVELNNRITELENKNNDLKNKLKAGKDINVSTKAKELIKRLMHELVVSNRPYDEVELLVKDVEQFLKENITYERIQKAKYNYTD